MEQSFVGTRVKTSKVVLETATTMRRKENKKINVWKLAFVSFRKQFIWPNRPNTWRNSPNLSTQKAKAKNSAQTHLLLKSNLSSSQVILRYSAIFLLRFHRLQVNHSSRWATTVSPLSRVWKILLASLTLQQTLSASQPSQHPIVATVRQIHKISCLSFVIFAYYYYKFHLSAQQHAGTWCHFESSLEHNFNSPSAHLRIHGEWGRALSDHLLIKFDRLVAICHLCQLESWRESCGSIFDDWINVYTK